MEEFGYVCFILGHSRNQRKIFSTAGILDPLVESGSGRLESVVWLWGIFALVAFAESHVQGAV